MIAGFFYSTGIYQNIRASLVKAVAVVNNSGNIRPILSSYYHPTQYFSVEGIARIL